jgi:hypothetical protein
MKLIAWKIAVPFARATPVLVLFSSSCTVHLRPFGLAVWMILDAFVFHQTNKRLSRGRVDRLIITLACSTNFPGGSAHCRNFGDTSEQDQGARGFGYRWLPDEWDRIGMSAKSQ